MRWGAAAVAMLVLASSSAGCDALDDSGELQRAEAGPGLERVVVRRDGDKLKADFDAGRAMAVNEKVIILRAQSRAEGGDQRTYVTFVLEDSRLTMCRGSDTSCGLIPQTTTTVWRRKSVRIIAPWPDVPKGVVWVGSAATTP